jgi:hypothetical protein
MYKLQSILFSRYYYTLKQCIDILKRNNLQHYKVDETKNFYRFRQIDPKLLRKDGYTNVITKKIARGIEYVIFYKNISGYGTSSSTVERRKAHNTLLEKNEQMKHYSNLVKDDEDRRNEERRIAKQKQQERIEKEKRKIELSYKDYDKIKKRYEDENVERKKNEKQKLHLQRLEREARELRLSPMQAAHYIEWNLKEEK